jgi:VWFA-related protein
VEDGRAMSSISSQAPLVAFALSVVLSGQQPRFSVNVEVVRVDALVTSGGRPVTGLTPEDFEVRDDGVMQRIDAVAVESVPLRIVVALDTSGSVAGARLDALTEAARAALDSVTRADSVTVLGFSNVIRLIAQQRGNSSAAPDLRGLEAAGSTGLYDAAHAALLLARSEEGRSLALVFSDGRDNSGWLDEPDLLQTARRAGVVAYTVGLEPPNRWEDPNGPLQRLADATSGRMLLARSDRQLRETFLRVLDEFRQRYLITYTPSGVTRAGWHTIQVRVKRRGAVVKARAGYDR